MGKTFVPLHIYTQNGAYQRCSVLLHFQLFVGGLVSYLRYVSLFAYIGVWCLCFVCLRLACAVLPVSLDCQFLNNLI